MQPLDRGGKKGYIFRPGHMTKMAAMPIYGKNLKKKFFFRTANPKVIFDLSVKFSKDFSSETTGPISIKFHMQPLDRGGKKVLYISSRYMTKMVATPIYGKNLKKSSSPELLGRLP